MALRRRRQPNLVLGDGTLKRGNFTSEVHQILALELIHPELIEMN
jgi:hypothetical protein